MELAVVRDLHSTDSSGNHVGGGRGLGDLQETGQVDQKSKDTGDKGGKEEAMEGSKALLVKAKHDLWVLAAQEEDGSGSQQGKCVVVVDKVDRRVVDSAEWLLDDNGVEGGGDRRNNAKEDTQLGNIELRGDSSVESAKDDEACSEDKLGGRLSEKGVGENDGEREDQSTSNLFPWISDSAG